MPYTLAQLKTQLRLRLGEPEDGTLSSSVTYEDEASVDEWAEIINQGAKQVTIDCLEMGNGLLVSQQNFSIQQDVTEYALPTDFISVIDLYHQHQGTTYRLTQHPLRGLKDGYRSDATADVYENYDVYGQSAKILAEGYVTGGATTTLNDDNADFNGASLTVNGDIVRNLSDNSFATLTNVTATTLTTQALSGGSANSFEAGDSYQVESKEEVQQVLHTYPPLSSSEREAFTSGTTAKTFGVPYADGARNLHSLDATFSTIPTGRVSAVIQYSTDGGSNFTDSQIEAAVDVTAATSYTFNFPSSSMVYAKLGSGLTDGGDSGDLATYRVVFTDLANNSDVSANVSSWEVFSFQGREGLELHYARYPVELTAATAQLELPDWSVTAIVLYAEYIGRMKLNGGRSNESAQAYQEYLLEVERIKRMMHMRNSDRSRVVANVFGSRVIPSHKNVPINIKLPLG